VRVKKKHRRIIQKAELLRALTIVCPSEDAFAEYQLFLSQQHAEEYLKTVVEQRQVEEPLGSALLIVVLV